MNRVLENFWAQITNMSAGISQAPGARETLVINTVPKSRIEIIMEHNRNSSLGGIFIINEALMISMPSTTLPRVQGATVNDVGNQSTRTFPKTSQRRVLIVLL